MIVTIVKLHRKLKDYCMRIKGCLNMYTNEEKAIRFVVKAFENQKRIKENINLSVHSISVGFMLKDIGCSEEVVISGLLHDIIEDTDYNYDYILDNYGKKIADNVLSVSENIEIKDWRERKIEFINRLYNESEDVVLVELADKLHNLLSDYPLWEEKGNDALATLKTTYEMNKWFYSEIGKIFNVRINKDNKLLKRYNNIYNIYFNN